MKSLWNRSLAGQFVAFMLLALIIGQATAYVISSAQRQAGLRQAVSTDFISRTSAMASVMLDLTGTTRNEILQAAATPYARFWITPGQPTDGAAWLGEAGAVLAIPQTDILATDLTTTSASSALPAPFGPQNVTGWGDMSLPTWTGPAGAELLEVANEDLLGVRFRLDDGSWLNAISYKPIPFDLSSGQSVMSFAITAAILAIFGIVASARIARPMRHLARSAEALGRGETVSLPNESGPDDIRNLYDAFDQMQTRLRRFVDDRTRMLGAIGHDLRTPLTSLRLRAEYVGDEDLKEKMIGTIEEMQAMTEATLAFARNETEVEQTRAIDLAALLGSLCDDLVELGNKVSFVESERLDYRCRPDSLRRAVRNLIENAVRYAGDASVGLDANPDSVVITIKDHGPGIAEEALEQVFEPFYRLEQSRNRNTGGVGLGLSIARAIARQHGGDLVLENSHPGLQARIVLPATP